MSGAGRRPVIRWAWRMFRREWRQQLLVLVLLTVTVAAAVTGSVMAVNATSDGHGFGDAGAIVRLDGQDPAAAQAQAARALERFGPYDAISHSPVPIPGSTRLLDLRGATPGGRFSGPLLRLRAGRYPTSDAEVALTATAADLLATGIGRTVALAGVERTVVGRVENPSDLDDLFALVPFDATRPADVVTLLVGSADPGVERESARPEGAAAVGTTGAEDPGFRVEVIGDDDAAVATLVLVVTTLALSLVGLIAAAGFVVIAQRRQRQLGMLAALGATGRHLRLVMLANGAIVGLVAAVAGGVLGIGGWFAVAPVIERAANHRIDRLDLPLTLIGACLVLALLASLAAAWWPARLQARVPVMAALSRRPTRPAPVHRSILLAAGLTVAGVVAIGQSRPTGTVRPAVLIAGVLAVVVGIVLASPAAIRVLALPARRLPFAARLAVRDLARHQARAASALAAITLGLGISVGVVAVAGANAHRSDEGNLSDRQMVVHRQTPESSDSPEAAEAVAAAVDHDAVVPLQIAFDAEVAGSSTLREPISATEVTGPGSFSYVGLAFVATPAVLEHLGIDPASIDPATDLLTSEARPLYLLDASTRPDERDPGSRDDTPTSPTQHVDTGPYTHGPRFLITEAALQRHGWVAQTSGWLVEARSPITGDQERAARATAADLGLDVEVREDQDALATVSTVATAIGGLLALAVVVMTIGLLRTEAAADVRTLAATGARSRTRRAITATTAGALAGAGVVLSVVGAYVAIAAAYRSELDRLAPLPVSHLLLLAVGLPAVAVAGGWLLAGPGPRSFARQQLD